MLPQPLRPVTPPPFLVRKLRARGAREQREGWGKGEREEGAREGCWWGEEEAEETLIEP